MAPEALDEIVLHKMQPSSELEWAEVSKPLSKQARHLRFTLGCQGQEN